VIRYPVPASLAIVIAFCLPCAAGDEAEPDVTAGPADPAAQVTLAREEAAAQAFHLLYQRFGRLQLTPESHVADFLDAEPGVRAAAWDALQRRADVSRPQVYSDGVVAVQVHLPVSQIIAHLKSVCAGHYAGKEYQPEDFDRIPLYTDRRGLWALGASRGTERPVTAGATPVGWYDVGVFGRLRTRRQATDNAHRRLLGRIRDLRCSPSKRLAAFLDSDKRIAADMTTFIHSHPNVGDVRYLPQRICEVDVTVTVADVVTELKSLANAYHTGAEWPQDVFDDLSLFVKAPEITVTGVAVPEPPGDGEQPPPAEDVWTHTAQADLPENVEDPAQAHLLATRSALARCREHLRSRWLAEPLPAAPHDDAGETPADDAAKPRTVADLVDDVPEVRTDLDTFLGNLRLVQVKDLTGGRVKVTAELPRERFDELLRYYLAKAAAADDAE